jgi:bis(5'-nucleosyl)-tetraphosphatase (symmetrical)
MALYLIGDLQGCDEPLQRLLSTVDFSPSRDTLFVLGDLVNRGPASAAVLRRLMGYGDAARCLLGNHDLHLLAAAYGARKPHKDDTLGEVLQAPDRNALLHWLRHQRLAMLEQFGNQQYLMVHAGVLPAWTAIKTIALAHEVESALQSAGVADFLAHMYGNVPSAWSETLAGPDRLRVIVNALTRMRFCTPQGEMEFKATGGADMAPAGYMPWFDVPGRCTSDVCVAFGHWSTLGWLARSDVLALDSGCVWGGCLSALRIEPGAANAPWPTALVQVQCAQAQKPQ